jgi:hypothetical protein
MTTQTPSNQARAISLRQGAALATVLALFTATLCFSQEQHDELKASQPDLSLLPLVQAAECHSTSSEARLQHAAQLQQMAVAKMQRAAFVASDGVQAANLLSEACICLQQAGNAAESQHSLSQWDHWVSDLSTQFQSHRLRFDLALQSRRTGDALTEVRALKAMLQGSPLPPDAPLTHYQRWLDAQERQLTANPGTRH